MDTINYLPLDVACKRALLDYRGGISGFAAGVGWSASTLHNKLNPTVETNHLYANEAQEILEFTRSPLILQAMTAPAFAGYVDLSAIPELPGDQSVFESISLLLNRVTDLSNEVQAALDDKKLTEKEEQKLQGAANQLVSAAFGIVELCKKFR